MPATARMRRQDSCDRCASGGSNQPLPPGFRLFERVPERRHLAIADLLLAECEDHQKHRRLLCLLEGADIPQQGLCLFDSLIHYGYAVIGELLFDFGLLWLR